MADHEIEYRTHMRQCVRLSIVPMRRQGFVAAIQRAIRENKPYAVVRHERGVLHIHPLTGATTIERE